MREGVFDHVRVGDRIIATAGSTGLAQGSLGPVAAGYCWYVERLTTFNPRANSVLEVFAIAVEELPAGFSATVGDRAGRQDVSVAANNDVADQASPIYVPEGYFLVAFWSGLTEGDIAQLSAQIAVHQKLNQTMAGWQQAQSSLGAVPDEIDVPDPLGQQYAGIPT